MKNSEGGGRTLIQNADYIYTFNNDREVIRNGSVLLEGNKIISIGNDLAVEDDVDTVIDASGKIVLPGFVNVHHHFYQNVTRAIPYVRQCTILDWLKYLYCLWAFIKPGDIRVATEVSASELLLSGCTTTADFMYLYPGNRPELFDEEVEAAGNMGIRLHAVRGSLSVFEEALEAQIKDLHIDTDSLLENTEDILYRSRKAFEEHHDESSDSMIRIALGPTTMDYGDIGFLKELKNLATDHNARFHFHLHPRDDERELCRRLYKTTPLEYLEENGLLDSRTWIAHATNHTTEDIDVLARTGAGVSHSPSCHMRLGYNVAPIPEMKRRNIPVGIGVDGGASNDSGNMLSELRTTLLVHRIRGVHPGETPDNWFTPRDVFEMATIGGATVLGREKEIGSLEPGKLADLVGFDLETIGFAGTGNDPLAKLLFCGLDYRTSFTIVNGNVLVRDGHIPGLDERGLVRKANAVTDRLMTEAGEVTGIDFSA